MYISEFYIKDEKKKKKKELIIIQKIQIFFFPIESIQSQK